MKSTLLLTLTLSACASAPSSTSTSASASTSTSTSTSASTSTSDLAPSAFSPAQLHDASHVGRHYEMRIEKPGAPTRVLVYTFREITPTDALMESHVIDESGTIVKPSATNRATWADLSSHGAFARAGLVVTSESITTPIGTFDCAVYTITKGSGADATTSRFYFAKAMPGPPILFYTEKSGQRVMTTTVVKYDPGHD